MACKYGGMDASMMSRLNKLEAENSRLKKMYAEERLKAEILKEAIEKSGHTVTPKRIGEDGGDPLGYFGSIVV